MLQQINLDDPEQSPLLVIPQGNHASRGRSVFFGRSGTGQIRSIRNWIRRYVEHQSRTRLQHVTSKRPAKSPSTSPVAAASIPVQSDMEQVRDSGSPQTRMTDNNNRGRQLIDAVLKDERPDAFDPDAFNRQQRAGHAPSTADHRKRQGSLVPPRLPSQPPQQTAQRQRHPRSFAIGHSLPNARRVPLPRASQIGAIPNADMEFLNRNRLLVPEALWNRQQTKNALNLPGGLQR
jgi:hypothetical protein